MERRINNHAVLLISVVIIEMMLLSCTPPKNAKQSVTRTTNNKFSTNSVTQNINPAWLTSDVRIPEYAIDEATQYRKYFLVENSQSASDLTYNFFYDGVGDACLEATVTQKNNYIWEPKTWIRMRWGKMTGEIGLGEIKYVKTKKNVDEAEYRIEERRKDKAFAEIEKIVFQLASEYDYDYMGAYGVKVKYRTANVKKAFCEGYSNATKSAFAKHPLVDHVENYAGGNHEWNVIVLKDGRKIYTDVTWYDGNSIDDEGYVVHIPDRDPVNLTFDVVEFNSLGGAIDLSTGRPVKTHFDFRDARRVE